MEGVSERKSSTESYWCRFTNHLIKCYLHTRFICRRNWMFSSFCCFSLQSNNVNFAFPKKFALFLDAKKKQHTNNSYIWIEFLLTIQLKTEILFNLNVCARLKKNKLNKRENQNENDQHQILTNKQHQQQQQQKTVFYQLMLQMKSIYIIRVFQCWTVNTISIHF